MLQRPPAGTSPETPGSYQFKDKDGRVIYVGKAHSLRSRLSNYFVSPSSLPARTAQMVAAAESVVAEIVGMGGRAAAFQGDVSVDGVAERAVDDDDRG